MSFDLVLFGGTGDLTWRRLMPALFQAHRHGSLPEGGRILAIARHPYGDDDYRSWLRERFRDVEERRSTGEHGEAEERNPRWEVDVQVTGSDRFEELG